MPVRESSTCFKLAARTSRFLFLLAVFFFVCLWCPNGGLNAVCWSVPIQPSCESNSPGEGNSFLWASLRSSPRFLKIRNARHDAQCSDGDSLSAVFLQRYMSFPHKNGIIFLPAMWLPEISITLLSSQLCWVGPPLLRGSTPAGGSALKGEPNSTGTGDQRS